MITWLTVFVLICYGVPWCLALIKHFEYGSYGEAVAVYMMVLPTAGMLAADVITNRLKDRFIFWVYVCVFVTGSVEIIMILSGMISLDLFKIAFEIIEVLASITVLGYCLMNDGIYLNFKPFQFVVMMSGMVAICIIPVFCLEHKGTIETVLLSAQCLFYYPFISVIFNGITLFGEEYCWRGRLLLKLSARFGRRAGTILIGIIWELWHIPLWFVLYNAQSQSGTIIVFALCRFATTISIGIFLSYVYFQTSSVWCCCIIHGLYDVIAQTYVFENLNYTENMGLIVSSLAFCMFIFSKTFDDSSHSSGGKIEG